MAARIGRRSFNSALLLAVGSSLTAARPSRAAERGAAGAADDLAAKLRPVRERAGLPAMGAVVVRGGGRAVALGVEGVRRAGGTEKVTPADRWHIGSNTKSMTATLCAMLVEEGKLKWATTIADVFPTLAPQMNPRWRTVTLEQLLTNRAGMPGDLLKTPLWGQLWAFKGKPEQARDLLLRGVTANAPEAEPGTQYIYSNAGFAVAGHMAETVMKTPWEALLRQRLFGPLGMTSAGFGAPGTARAVDQPRGHSADGKPHDPGPGADNPVAIGPAGIVHCSLTDYGKYLALHLRGETDGGGEKKLLKPETFKKLHEPATGPGTKYAMGWIVVSDYVPGTGRALTHDGSNTMWYVTAWVLPEHDVAMAVACNQGGEGAAKACYEVAQQLMREYLAREH